MSFLQEAEVIECFVRLFSRFNEWIIARTDENPYNNLLIAPGYICTLCITTFLTLNIGISMKGAINSGWFIMYLRGQRSRCNFVHEKRIQ